MHEWALAESVVYAVSDEVKKNKLVKLSSITVVIGELQQIELDIFKFALENMFANYDPAVDGKDIILETEPAVMKCNVCEKQWYFADNIRHMKDNEAEAVHFIPEIAHTYMRCPACGSPDFNIKEGRGVWIKSIEGEA